MKQKSVKSGENSVNGSIINENSSEVKKNDQKTPKVEEKPMKSLEDQAKDLKAKRESNPETLPESIRKPIAKKPRSRKPKTQSKGGVTMDLRTKDERILEKVAKGEKCATQRINPKATSKSGRGALRALHSDGSVKAAVRSNDVVIFAPQSKIGYGRPGPKGWEHVTVFNHGDPNLEKALRKGLKDKKSSATWKKDVGATGRVQAVSNETLAAKEKRLAKELSAVRAAKKRASKPKKKPSKAGSKAITTVATPAT